MVALSVVTLDVVENVAFLAAPPLLWGFLYLFAWETPAVARASGFGRLTFWLLLPGSLLGVVADAPFAAIGPAVLTINVGGGLIPLVLAAFLLRRHLAIAPGAARLFAALVTVGSAVALAWVLVLPRWSSSGAPWDAAGVALALGVPVVGAALAAPLGAGRRTLTFALGLAALALFLTFATTAAVPGVGIVSAFPEFLLAPVLVGVVAVLAGPTLGRVGLPAAFGLAYATTTLGTLVGADVLRQPPLYAAPASAIYSIGGAGLLDLLYLSGLLALGGAYLTYELLVLARARPRYVPSPAEFEPLGTVGGLRLAMDRLVDGDYVGSVRASTAAATEARGLARQLNRLPPSGDPDRSWADLGAPGWIDADHRNLAALATTPGVGARDAWRAHLTARHLVRVGEALDARRFAAIGRRASAFAVDLAVLVVPAALVWWLVARTATGSLGSVLGGVPFNAAALGFMAYGLLYFVVLEATGGATVGKRLFRLIVRDRALRGPPTIPVLVRDLPKLIPLAIVGFAGPAATLLVVRGVAAAGSSVNGANGVTIPADLLAITTIALGVAIGLVLCGLASALTIASTRERQRVGDLLAGTWVIQE